MAFEAVRDVVPEAVEMPKIGWTRLDIGTARPATFTSARCGAFEDRTMKIGVFGAGRGERRLPCPSPKRTAWCCGVAMPTK